MYPKVVVPKNTTHPTKTCPKMDRSMGKGKKKKKVTDASISTILGCVLKGIFPSTKYWVRKCERVGRSTLHSFLWEFWIQSSTLTVFGAPIEEN